MDSSLTPLLRKVLTNALNNPTNLAKYGRVNLLGNAGGRLAASPEAMVHLCEAGWVVEGDYIVLAAVVESRVRAVIDSLPADSGNANGNSNSAEEKKEEAPLSLKQQANRDREERERQERLASQLKSKKARLNGPKISMKKQALMKDENKMGDFER